MTPARGTRLTPSHGHTSSGCIITGEQTGESRTGRIGNGTSALKEALEGLAASERVSLKSEGREERRQVAVTSR